MSIPSSFNVSATSGILGSYLSPTNATGIFGAISSSSTNPTTAALQSGKLTNTQFKIIQAVAGAGTQGYAITYNANGTEPSKIATVRSYGWLKLVGKSVDPTTKAVQGTYVLTQVGKAIYNRTGGGKVGSSSDALSASELTDSSSATANLSSSVSALTSTLSSLGVNISV